MRSRPVPPVPGDGLVGGGRNGGAAAAAVAVASRPPASTSSSPGPASIVRLCVKLLVLATSSLSPSETLTGNAWSATPHSAGPRPEQPAPGVSGAENSLNGMRRSKPPLAVPCISSAFTSPGAPVYVIIGFSPGGGRGVRGGGGG